MSIDLIYLTGSVGIFFVHLLAEVVTANLQHTPKDLLGARDKLPPHNAAVLRAKRATQNMLEAMIMFVPLVLIAHATNVSNEMTALGAAIFFWCRLAYAPAYWFGIPVARSLIWFGGIIGTILIFIEIVQLAGAS